MLQDLLDSNTAGLVFFKHARHKVFSVITDLEPTWLVEIYFSIDYISFHIIFVHGHKRHDAREEHVHHYARTPNVCGLVVGKAQENLWGAIGEGPV